MDNAGIEIFKKGLIGKKIAVLGIGISNLPALDFLSNCGSIITACDMKEESLMDEKVMEKVKPDTNAAEILEYLG